MSDPRDIALSVDPNTTNDVCTFCRHAAWEGDTMLAGPTCGLGYTSYFRSISNLGPIWVSDCNAGELLPELKELEAQP